MQAKFKKISIKGKFDYSINVNECEKVNKMIQVENY